MIEVFGGSDDLIEIEGDIDEEFTASPKKDLLAFSDGTVLKIWYSDSIWKIYPVVRGSAFKSIVYYDDSDETYSDTAYLGDGVTWIVQGKAITRSK